jgi:hypothetical protein
MPMKKILFWAMICAMNLRAQSAPAQSPHAGSETWKTLQFLIGTWEAKTQGGSSGAASNGTYLFRLELKDHLLARHTAAAACAGPADFDCEHADLLYIYPAAPGQPSFKAIYFDNEGHVIHYDVSVPTGGTAVFLSDPKEPGPQYRLSYELKGEVMSGRFEIRMPGRAEFASYLQWSGRRK